MRRSCSSSKPLAAALNTEVAATATGPAMTWQTLEFDFGTDARSFTELVVFVNFNVNNATPQTFYIDNIIQVEGDGGGGGMNGTQVDLPVTFDEAGVDYSLVDFEGTASSVVEDPIVPGNMVAQTVRGAGGQTFAGTTITAPGPPQTGFANRIALSEDRSVITMRVWSPAAGIPVRMKIEDANDGNISVETEANTTVAMQWETLSFDFKNQATDTAPVNYASFYNKLTVFFNFGTVPGADATYFWDDVILADGTGGGGNQDIVTLPVNFEGDDVNFDFFDFNGTFTEVIVDPTDANNMVASTTKGAGAETFAGTILGATNGLGAAIDFSEDRNIISVRVWSPTAGTPVRVKVENAANGAISVETEELTTVAMQFETLEFDFRDNAAENVIDYDAVYDKFVIFFDFDTSPAADATYFWDDVILLESTSTTTPITGALEAYPNPVYDRVTLSAPQQMESVTIYSASGQRVSQFVPSVEQMDVDVTGYAPGFYVALVVANGQAHTVRFLKK